MNASVIITTYNQGALLRRLLSALATQTIKDFEVIVIDDASTDITGQVCDEASLSYPQMHIRYIRVSSRKGIGSCRNLGIRSSAGEFLLFTDSDCVPDRDWAEKLRGALQEKPVIAGAVRSPESKYFLLCHNIAQFHRFLPENKSGTTMYIAGANMGIRREVFEITGYFEEGREMAEDMEWVLRAGDMGFFPYFLQDIAITHIPGGRSGLWPILRYAAIHAESTITLREQFSGRLRTPFFLKSVPLLFLASPALAFFSTIENFITNPGLFRYFRTMPVFFLIRLSWCKGAIKGLQHMKER